MTRRSPRGPDGPTDASTPDVPAPVRPRWLNDREQALWRDYLMVMRNLMDRLNRQLGDDADLTLAEYDVLVHLSEAPQHRLRMSELAGKVVNSRSRLSHTVNRLAQRGFVDREDCPDDRRGVWCLLLDDGFAALEAAAPGHVEAVRSLVLDPLDDADVEALAIAMRKARERLLA